MGITNGTTRVTNLALECLALESEAHGITGMILAQADAIQREDQENDPVLIQALKAFERAMELDEGTDRQASMLQGVQFLKEAIALDLNEQGAARLRALVMPFHNKLDALMNETRSVIGDLANLKTHDAGHRRVA